MTDTTTPAELEIPHEAYVEAREAVRADGIRGAGAFVTAPAAVRAAAPVIVAAELRRLADEAMKISDEEMAKSHEAHSRDSQCIRTGRSLGSAAVAHLARARADELAGAGDA